MNFRLSYLLLSAIPLWLLGFNGVASAQISIGVDSAITPVEPAATLSTNIEPATATTTVTQQGNQFNILGGQSSDGPNPNLIHQFQQFDLSASDAANFVVNPNIANVISLINSLQPSSIEGLLKLTSTDPNLGSNANLFLVNPAGIIFGEQVRLQLPANLTATTASGLLFENNYLVSIDGSLSAIALPTSEPNALPTSEPVNASSTTPTPTISNLTGAPTGYLFLAEPASSIEPNPLSSELPTGTIENQGNLQVAQGATITLLGEYIQNDGNLVAPSGEINLVATSGENLLRLSQPGSLLTLDVIPVDILEIISSGEAVQSSIATLPTTELAQILTGGPDQNATQLVVNSDGSQTLTNTPILSPAPGSVLVRGVVDVSDSTPAELDSSPGQVNILGDQIHLVGGDVYANGVGQAGTVFIGGMPVVDSIHAANISVSRDSEISANSSQDNGGTIYIGADETVWFYGSATATGATPSLDGTVTIDAGNLLDIRRPIDP